MHSASEIAMRQFSISITFPFFPKLNTRLGTNHFRNISIDLSRSRARPIVLVNVRAAYLFPTDSERDRSLSPKGPSRVCRRLRDLQPSAGLSVPRTLFYSKHPMPNEFIFLSPSIVETKARSGIISTRRVSATSEYFLTAIPTVISPGKSFE